MQRKTLFGLSAFLAVASLFPRMASSRAQALQENPPASPISTTVCALAGNPKSFAGKTISLRATIIINHIYEGIADPVNCRGKEVFLRENDARQQDAVMRHFDSALRAQFVPIKKRIGTCMYSSCPQFTVSATLVGKLDYPISELGNNLAARLELVSVSQVDPVENEFDPKLYRRP